MDVLMEAVAEAISQARREAAAAHAEATSEATLTREEPTLTEATLTRKEEQKVEARRRGSNFLQAMRNLGGDQASEQPRGHYGRRRGKNPATSRSQEAEEVTPPKHKAQQYTPPTRPYGGP